MSKLTGPLFSLTARGTIASTLTYSAWRGVPYVRSRVIPANPQSTTQTEVRNIFAFLSETWKRAPALFQAPWSAFATGQPFTNRNEIIRRNIPALQGQADLNAFVWSPGALGGPAPLSIATTPAADQITVDFTVPTAPTGWTLAAAIAAAMFDGDAESIPFRDITAEEDTSAPYSVVLTGLTDVGIHQVGGWLRWTRPDGTTAYSTALSTQETPS